MTTPTPQDTRCDVEFEDGRRCAKAAGHWTPTNGDPHVPTSPDAGPEVDEMAESLRRDGFGDDEIAIMQLRQHLTDAIRSINDGGVMVDLDDDNDVAVVVEAVLPVVAARDAQTRAQALREAAGYARSRSADNWGAASGSPSTVLCTVSDELRARADGIHRGQA